MTLYIKSPWYKGIYSLIFFSMKNLHTIQHKEQGKIYQKIADIWCKLALLSLLLTWCGDNKSNPTKAWEKYDSAKDKTEELQKDIEDKKEEIRKDNDELRILQQELVNAQINQQESLQKAQKESKSYQGN